MKDPLSHTKGGSWFAIIFLLAIFTVAVFVLSKDSPAFTSSGWTSNGTAKLASRRYVVTYRSGVFSPTNLRVDKHDIIVFSNQSNSDLHIDSNDTSAADDMIRGKVIPSGKNVEVTFSLSGQVRYFNKENDSESGTIIIK